MQTTAQFLLLKEKVFGLCYLIMALNCEKLCGKLKLYVPFEDIRMIEPFIRKLSEAQFNKSTKPLEQNSKSDKQLN